ncbi:transglutaminase family protein [Sphingobium amiense]|uniref:Transglutaminase family protein n=1 Tax=Sphingobium amiense TaxID=135719 RepID=A0A494W928_9SPHN|nr:transglutaminase family protein [Sphingobium amiense]BBD96945.1 transglutaminase family protein [Sphingobium amiense]
MKLLVRHQTTYRYSASAGRVAMRLKLMPVDTPAQTVDNWQVSINDEPVLSFRPNAYGESEAIWIRHDRMDDATIVAEGLVETRDTHGILGPLSSKVPPPYFLRDTHLTRPSEAISELARGLPVGEGPLARLHALSAAVADAVQYRSGVTLSTTTAAEAFALGAGVCQDHAQVFIAAARSLGVPARYVSGYLLAGDGDLLHETHGWAEAYLPDLGWIGFDPSNRVCATDRYLRVASGLDADDAAPIRGSVTLTGDIMVEADVRISVADEGVEQRQLQRQQQQIRPQVQD